MMGLPDPGHRMVSLMGSPVSCLPVRTDFASLAWSPCLEKNSHVQWFILLIVSMSPAIMAVSSQYPLDEIIVPSSIV